jgi:hypothetical protein
MFFRKPLAIAVECSMNLYTVNLEKFHIDNTRSRSTDTDTVTFGLQIAQQQFKLLSLSVGDVNNGDHALNLKFPVVVTEPTTPFVLTFSIYNGNASQLPKTLADLTQTVAQNTLDDILNPGPPTSGPSDYSDPTADPAENQDSGDPWDEPGSANVGWQTLLSYVGIADLIFPDCDGFVAMDSLGQTLAKWDQAISASPNSVLRRSTRYPGTNSAAGCGSNSDYTVTWSVSRERIAGSMRQFLKSHSLALQPGIRSLS